MKCYIASLNECKKGDLIPAVFFSEDDKESLKYKEIFAIDIEISSLFTCPQYQLRKFPKVYSAKLLGEFKGELFKDKVEIIKEVEFSKNKLKKILNKYYNCSFALSFVAVNKNTDKELLNILTDHPDRFVKMCALKSLNADEEILLKAIQLKYDELVICAIHNKNATEKIIWEAYALNYNDIKREISKLKNAPEELYRKIIREKKDVYSISCIIQNKYISDNIVEEIRKNLDPDFLYIYKEFKGRVFLDWFIIKKSKKQDWDFIKIR